MGINRLATPEDAVQIDRHQRPPVLGRHILGGVGAVVSPAADAGVADQYVDASEGLGDLLHQGEDLFPVRDVDLTEVGLVALPLQGLDAFRSFFFQPVG